jgi:dienelactone hydrolase
MAEVLLFHHVLGLTDGVLSFADELRAGGHVVHTPDLFGGKTFVEIGDGIAYAEGVGFGTIVERGGRTADGLPEQIVYAGFSLGVLPAQKLAQTRPGARGALFFHACIPSSEFGGEWPHGVPAQIHMMEGDEFVQEGDLDAAHALVDAAEGAELFLYPGDRHLFADSSTPDYDEAAAALLTERVLAFLARVD